MNKKTIYTIEAVLMVICCFIGFFEDAFVAGAFIIACIYNLIVCIFYKKWTGDKFYKFILNMLFEWSVFLFSCMLLYGLHSMIFGCTDHGFFGDHSQTYRGIDALLNDLFFIVVGIPCLIVNGLYSLIYYLTVIGKRNR